MIKLQYKLVRILLLTSIVPIVAVAIITIYFIERIAIDEAYQKINNNLNIAQTIYDNVLKNLKYTVRDQNRRVYTLLENNKLGVLRNELKKITDKVNLDLFIITDQQGKIITSIINPNAEGKYLSNDFAIQKARKGEVFIGTEIFQEEQLRLLGLHEKAKIPGVEKTEGFVVRVVLPVINQREEIIGAMSAGYLLNNNNEIIVNKIQKATGGLLSSIFLGDLRICTNIPPNVKEYAVGRRLSSAKIKQAIKQGRRFISRVIAAGKHYIVGYTPLYDSNNAIMGCIGIGISGATIFALRNSLIMLFALAVSLTIILALVFGILRGRVIVKSIDKLRYGTEAVSKGDFEYRIDMDTKDEIEELANLFNAMMEQLKIYKQQNEEYSKILETKVVEKTSELELMNKRLIEYEKMAAMGRMATVLGHELRNVFAGIQTIAYWLKGKAAKTCPELSNSIKDLEYEINYANDILNNVLRFSRPQKITTAEVDINAVVEGILDALNVEEVFKNIEVVKSLDSSLRKIIADGVQIKEVISNLVINAVQAMPRGGRLTIVTRKEPKLLRLEIGDTGSGIPDEVIGNLFTPFFTTKSRGLGLGLCISKEIIEAHRGKIEVKTQVNKGTTFIITLPLESVT